MIKKNLVAFLTGSILMLPVFFARNWVPGNDSDYHLAMARYPAELATASTFPWLHWSYLRESFVSHHMGFHLAMSPFIRLSDSLTGQLYPGAQAALLACAGLTALCFFRILQLRGIPAPFLWVMLLGALPWQFWLRLSNFRAPALALPMLLFAIELFLRRKYRALGLWACLFVLVYFGAVLFALVAAGMLLAIWIDERRLKSALAPGLIVALGLLAGFFLHPAFPEVFEHMKIQLFSSGLSGAPELGNEWHPPPAWNALLMWLPVLIIWWVMLALRLQAGNRADGTSLGFFVIAIAFAVLAVKARRFVEYAPVFLLLNAADLSRGINMDFLQIVWRRKTVKWGAAVLCLVLALSGPVQARMQARPGKATPAMAGAMKWLKKNSAPGSLVMPDDWDLFPACFSLNRHNTYAVGLDPAFTSIPYPEIWQAYRAITRGKKWPLEEVRGKIGADYVLVCADHSRLYQRLLSRPDLFALAYPDLPAGSTQPPVSLFKVMPATSP